MRVLGTLGLLLAAGSAHAQSPVDLLIVSGESNAQCAEDLRDMLRCTGWFSRVDVWDAAGAAPTAQDLDRSVYDAVLVTADGSFSDNQSQGQLCACQV